MRNVCIREAGAYPPMAFALPSKWALDALFLVHMETSPLLFQTPAADWPMLLSLLDRLRESYCSDDGGTAFVVSPSLFLSAFKDQAHQPARIDC